ncbi:MAG TPA: hypothetical protein VJ949_10105 [Cryomorphaceae bacterium]|nr:hypothetical protein [Cryomorphaceae bacterium]
MLRLFVTLVFASLLTFQSFGQHHRGYNDVFPSYGNFERRGWIFSPALTYMLPQLKAPSQRVFFPGGAAYDIDYNPAGKVGVGMEIGRFHVVDNSRLISHVQLNMGIKVLRGVERFEANLATETSSRPSALQNEGAFSHSYATMSFVASNIQQFSRTGFVQNSLGINGDYRIAEASTYNKNDLPIDLANPSRFIFQANYSLGVGFRVSGNILVVPTLETPILNIYEYNDLKSTLKVFNTRYRPFILRVSVYMLDNKPDRKCPKKKTKRKTVERLFK